MAVLAFEDQQRRVLPQDALGALEYPEFRALDVDLQQRDSVARVEIIVEGDHRHRQGRKAVRLRCFVRQRRAGRMARGNEQLLIAGMRIDRLGFNGDIVESGGAADLGKTAGEFRLRLESDHPARPAPARQPGNKTALVGADVAGDVAGPQVPVDDPEFSGLIAESRLQRTKTKPDTFARQPGLEKGHRSAFGVRGAG